MTSVPVEYPLALAIIATLEAEMGEGKVGYGQRPPAGGWASDTPSPATQFAGYAVVWPGSTLTAPDGSVADPQGDAHQSVQVTCVGKTAEQADAIRDRCRRALLARGAVDPDDDTRLLGFVEFRDSQAVARDDDVSPPLFMAADRFTGWTYPA